MGLFRTAIVFTGWSSLGAAIIFVTSTRRSKIYPVGTDDYIFNTTQYARLNANNAPYSHDICVRKVPLGTIKPELLEKEGRLVEAFSQGVWGGSGYAIQRRYLERKYRGPATASQLWDKKDLKSSNYDVGTLITDHFEVVSKTPESIIVRCGDSPRVQEPRASDGLFEMTAVIHKDKGVAEFGLKSVFFNSTPENKSVTPPMSSTIQWLHQLYDKVLMETAIRHVTAWRI